MYKELVITIIILAIIVAGNVITQNNTNKSVEEIDYEFQNLRKEIIEENAISAEEQIQTIEKMWKEKYEKMAYYIEHDELEKVETELVKLKANIETKEFKIAVECLDNCVFILEHIKDKSALKIVNVF